jgi:hypothetical protein
MINKFLGNSRNKGTGVSSQDRVNRDESQTNRTPIMNITSANRVARNGRGTLVNNMRNPDTAAISNELATARAITAPLSPQPALPTSARENNYSIERNELHIRNVVERCILELNANSRSPLNLKSTSIRVALDNVIYTSLNSIKNKALLNTESSDSISAITRSTVYKIVINFFSRDLFEHHVVNSVVQSYLTQELESFESQLFPETQDQIAIHQNPLSGPIQIDEQTQANFHGNDYLIDIDELVTPRPIIQPVTEYPPLPPTLHIVDSMRDQGILFIPAKINTWLNPVKLREKLSTSHTLQELSGAGSNCWWRSAWAVILTTAEPEIISSKIASLKNQCVSLQNEDDPRQLIDPFRFRQSAILARENIAEILLNFPVSRIKYHDDQLHSVNNGAGEELQPLAEEHLKLLTFEILKKIATDNNAGQVPEGHIYLLRQQIFENHMGDQLQIRELLQFFKADFVMLSVNASESFSNSFPAQNNPSSADALIANETKGVWFGLHNEEQQKQLESQLKEGSTAEQWNTGIELGWKDLPVLKINFSHFEVYFPKSFNIDAKNRTMPSALPIPEDLNPTILLENFHGQLSSQSISRGVLQGEPISPSRKSWQNIKISNPFKKNK